LPHGADLPVPGGAVTTAARALVAALAAALLSAPRARAAEDPRALVIEGEELLSANQPQRALETFRRVRDMLGTAPPRLQADLVRAAAAVGDDVLTQSEHEAWLRLEKRNAVVDAELRALATRAAERVSQREQRQSATAPLLEEERLIREAETQARDAEAARAREADVQFAADEAKRAMRSSQPGTAEAAIRRIDRTTATYPDHPRIGQLAVARSDLVTHAALMRQASAAMAEAAARQREKEGARLARRYYVLGSLEIAAGAAIACGGLYLMVAQPSALEREASIGFGVGAVALGAGMALVTAPRAFRAGAEARASTRWTLSAATLPTGAFVGAGRAF
jgi:hypothetical protein